MRFLRQAKAIRLGALLLLFITVAIWRVHRYMILSQPGRAYFTVADRLHQYEPTAGPRLQAHFTAAHVTYPPARVTLFGLKQEHLLQVYAAGPGQPLCFVHAYPVLAASGDSGPKLAEGDGQVPEGEYRIESLNPNSAYHLALRVSYPNDWDKQHGEADGRKDLGGDIMIHGCAGSCGCLAMGDPASEELFILAARTGIDNIRVLISPVDFRQHQAFMPLPNSPAWTGQLYTMLRSEISRLPAPTLP